MAEKESTTRGESRRMITDDANTNAKRPPLGLAATRLEAGVLQPYLVGGVHLGGLAEDVDRRVQGNGEDGGHSGSLWLWIRMSVCSIIEL